MPRFEDLYGHELYDDASDTVVLCDVRYTVYDSEHGQIDLTVNTIDAMVLVDKDGREQKLDGMNNKWNEFCWGEINSITDKLLDIEKCRL